MEAWFETLIAALALPKFGLSTVFVVSFVVAYGVVAWFMSWVRRHGFAPFAVYRIVLGTGVLWWASRMH